MIGLKMEIPHVDMEKIRRIAKQPSPLTPLVLMEMMKQVYRLGYEAGKKAEKEESCETSFTF